MEINTILILILMLFMEESYLVYINHRKLARAGAARQIFVDTSALIDGRILTIAKSGFLDGVLNIPRSVIGELQYVADHSDTEKRSRARHGLDVIAELQRVPGIKVEIFRDSSFAEEGVDERLLSLAKKYGGVICTIDYNLNKVAQVENIKVINVNDLAMGLRMAYLPGEKILLDLTTSGQDPHQAIGHLSDGTMVVVEHANKYIGKSVEVEFIRSLQTAAGKMMFARLAKTDNAGQGSTRFAVNKPGIATDKTNQASKNNVKKNNRRHFYSKKKQGGAGKGNDSEQSLINLVNKQ